MFLLNNPFRIKNVEVKNRILRSATVESKADTNGFVTDDLLELYYHLAVGGAGMLVTGAAAVEPAGKGFTQQICVFDDGFLPGLKKMADIVHKYGSGCKCAVQLFHRGAAGYGLSHGISSKGFSLKYVKPEEITATVKAFGLAARRVKEAGFDAVAVHAGHGYLLNQFLCPVTNNRDDGWGGCLENRMRFTLETYSAIRDQVGDGFPVLWKMNSADYIDGGNGIEQYARVAETLAKLGVDLIELTGGMEKQAKLRARLGEEAGEHEAYFYHAIDPMKKAVAGTKTSLAITGGIRSLPAMEELLKNGINLIGLCRPLICEPDLPNRLLNSPDKRRAKCTSCNKCLFHIARQPLKCLEFDPFRSVLARL